MSASRGAPIPQTGVAGFDRNPWQLSIGIRGKLRLESVAGFDRNQWQPSTGIRNPEDKYFPSYLVLATHHEEGFHILFATDVEGTNVRIITAYRPSPDEWESDGKTRRTP
jgi:hypothetical protein